MERPDPWRDFVIAVAESLKIPWLVERLAEAIERFGMPVVFVGCLLAIVALLGGAIAIDVLFG